ncbi:MAG: 50S ribosomal protein L22 [Candidatus Diapherotrites archaeon]|nr:50S ribosomal protein L22 [Candidatus Diapherotrites archaeon]
MVKKEFQLSGTGTASHLARAFASNQPVSFKYSVEICREIKGKKLDKAVSFLENVQEQKAFLPLRRYNKKVGHRKGNSYSFVKSGRYPKNACRAWLKLLESVKANADYKGLNADQLLVVHAFASIGFRRYSHQNQGRISGKRRRRKSTHIEVIVREGR